MGKSMAQLFLAKEETVPGAKQSMNIFQVQHSSDRESYSEPSSTPGNCRCCEHQCNTTEFAWPCCSMHSFAFNACCLLWMCVWYTLQHVRLRVCRQVWSGFWSSGRHAPVELLHMTQSNCDTPS